MWLLPQAEGDKPYHLLEPALMRSLLEVITSSQDVVRFYHLLEPAHEISWLEVITSSRARMW